MEESEESEPSPEAGPPATGDRADHRRTAPGVDLPGSPERREHLPDEEEDSQESQSTEDATDDDAAREREDDLS
jgi:hypothetical protein